MSKEAAKPKVSKTRMALALIGWAAVLLGPSLTFALVVLVRRPAPDALTAEIQRAVTAQMVWPLIALALFYLNAFWRLRKAFKARRAS